MRTLPPGLVGHGDATMGNCYSGSTGSKVTNRDGANTSVSTTRQAILPLASVQTWLEAAKDSEGIRQPTPSRIENVSQQLGDGFCADDNGQTVQCSQRNPPAGKILAIYIKGSDTRRNIVHFRRNLIRDVISDTPINLCPS